MSGRSQIQTKHLIIVCFLFFSGIFYIANVFWVFLFFFSLKKRRLNGSVFRLDGFAQVTQPLDYLHILFFFSMTVFKREIISQSVLT